MDGFTSNIALANGRIFKQANDHEPTSLMRSDLPSAPQNNTITPTAVAPVEDSVDINPMAQSVADLQAIIDKLNATKDGFEMVDALKGLKKFIDENTGAMFTGGILGELGEIAGNVLSELENDPAALGDTVKLSFKANFAAIIKTGEDFYDSKMSFSFKFSYESETTKMDAAMSMSSITKITENSFKYLSSESARISITTTVADIDKNPVLAGFGEIVARLTNTDPMELLGLAAPKMYGNMIPAPEAPAPVAENASEAAKTIGEILASLFVDTTPPIEKSIRLLEVLLTNIKNATESDTTQAAAA